MQGSEICQCQRWVVDIQVVGYLLQIREIIRINYPAARPKEGVKRICDRDLPGQDQISGGVEKDLAVGPGSQIGTGLCHVRTGAGITGVGFNGQCPMLHI